MVKKDEFDNAIESLRGEIAAIRTSLSDMKNDVMQALREENVSLKNTIETLEPQFESSDIIRNKFGQYNRRNNVVVDGIPSSVKKRELEDKCIEVLGKIDIKIRKTDIEACHHLDKSLKTIIRFVNRKFCSKILAKKSELSDMKKEKLTEIGLHETVKLFVPPNLSPYNEEIRFNCRKLRRKKTYLKYLVLFWISIYKKAPN